MKTVAFIQLGCRGDCANILPIMYQRHLAGDRVFCYVHEEFASIFEGVSYVEPVICTGSPIAVKTAYDRAIAAGHDEVFASQVHGAFQNIPQKFSNYALESWHRAGGKIGDYNRLPLVFDKLPPAIPRDGNLPRVGIALNGFSSPFKQRNEFKAWLLSVATGVEIVDLDIKLPRVIDLVPLIDSCDILIAIDSLPLHLSYAVGIPTIALHCDADPGGNHRNASWYRSEPRPHWVASMAYGQALTSAGKLQITSLLGINMPLEHKTPIVQVANWYVAADAGERRRMQNAKRSWGAVAAADGNWTYREPPRRRSSRDLGDTRVLPFVKDMLDEACRDSDIGVLTNSDIILPANAGDIIREHCTPVCYSNRIDIDAAGKDLGAYPGVDLVAVRSDWWREHRDEYPDFVIGCEAWDGVMWMWLNGVNPAARVDPFIRHETHANFWSKAENVTDNIGQRYNRSLATLWMIRHGKQEMFGRGNFLIR